MKAIDSVRTCLKTIFTLTFLILFGPVMNAQDLMYDLRSARYGGGDGPSPSSYGRRVDVSANRAVVLDPGSAQIIVFDKFFHVWYESARLRPPTRTSFLSSFGIATDGDAIIVEDWHGTHTYRRIGHRWHYQSLLPAAASAAISGDYIIQSTEGVEGGEVQFFEWLGDRWSATTSYPHTYFGVEARPLPKVDIDGDWAVLSVGQRGPENVLIFNRSPEGHWFHHSTLFDDRLTDEVGVGRGIAISGTPGDELLAVGRPLAFDGQGAVNVYSLNGSTWDFVSELSFREPADPNIGLGTQVAMSGNYIVAGTALSFSDGREPQHFVIFEDCNEHNFWQLRNVVYDPNSSGHAFFNTSFPPDLAIHSQSLVFGEPGRETPSVTGRAWAYTLQERTICVYQAIVDPPPRHGQVDTDVIVTNHSPEPMGLFMWTGSAEVISDCATPDISGPLPRLTLKPGEERTIPLSFAIDPDLRPGSHTTRMYLGETYGQPIASTLVEFEVPFPVRESTHCPERQTTCTDKASKMPTVYAPPQVVPGAVEGFVYHIAQPGPVNAAIYNAKAEKVHTLSEDLHKEGLHKQQWDGLLEGKKPAPAGQYFVHVDSKHGSHCAEFIVTEPAQKMGKGK